MVFGRAHEELIQLNESTVWTGAPYDPYGTGSGVKALPEIQKLVFAGKGREAEALFEKEWMSKTWEQAEYQPLADLRLTFLSADSSHGRNGPAMADPAKSGDGGEPGTRAGDPSRAY